MHEILGYGRSRRKTLSRYFVVLFIYFAVTMEIVTFGYFSNLSGHKSGRRFRPRWRDGSDVFPPVVEASPYRRRAIHVRSPVSEPLVRRRIDRPAARKRAIDYTVDLIRPGTSRGVRYGTRRPRAYNRTFFCRRAGEFSNLIGQEVCVIVISARKVVPARTRSMSWYRCARSGTSSCLW